MIPNVMMIFHEYNTLIIIIEYHTCMLSYSRMADAKWAFAFLGSVFIYYELYLSSSFQLSLNKLIHVGSRGTTCLCKSTDWFVYLRWKINWSEKYIRYIRLLTIVTFYQKIWQQKVHFLSSLVSRYFIFYTNTW